MHFFNPFSAFFYDHVFISYCVLFLFVILEGEIALIIAGVFVHLGILSMPVTIMLIMVGAVLKMVAGYRLGRYLGKKFPDSKLLKYFERRVLYFLPRFREKPFWSIILSKFIYGINNATIIFAGYAKADFRMYMKAELLSSMVWLGVMFSLGFFFSAKALEISHNFRNFSLLVVGFVVGFMVLQRGINFVIELAEEWTLKGKSDTKK
jgi:membrane protein DedA with SNARE-associated domain